jgi:hypothetical protein
MAGSDAQEKFNKLMEEELPIGFDKEKVYSMGLLYQLYSPPPCSEKVYQRLGTAKYLHTLEIRGKTHGSPRRKG